MMLEICAHIILLLVSLLEHGNLDIAVVKNMCSLPAATVSIKSHTYIYGAGVVGFPSVTVHGTMCVSV